MSKPVNDQLVGQLIAELLDGHFEACENAGTDAEPMHSLSAEGYEPDDIDAIDIVGGDEAHISLTTVSGKEFRIVVTERR